MNINTISEGITLSRKLETESAAFYENLALRYPQSAQIFLSFAQENKKNVIQIERTYYGVITDAIEGCFALDIDPADFVLATNVSDQAGYPDVINLAVKIEEQIIGYYSLAAEQSKPLMADIPRVFIQLTRKRQNRIPLIKALSLSPI
jgi:hypothetical protein